MRVARTTSIINALVIALLLNFRSNAAALETVVQAPYLADVTTFLLTSGADHRKYQISIAFPRSYSKEHVPYPVLIAADANAEFGTVVEAARLLALGREIPELLVVGIGYANPGTGFDASFALRSLDLTPTASPADLADLQAMSKRIGFPVPTATGGAAEFLSFIRNDLVPYLEAHYDVSHQDRAWFGHSYGGLFGVYALLNNDHLFQRFILGSPSLDFDSHVIFKEEEAYAASNKSMPGRVYLSVGGNEELVGDPMVSDLAHFVAQLRARRYDGLTVESEIFNGETHLSVIPLTISKGLRSVYSPTSQGGK